MSVAVLPTPHNVQTTLNYFAPINDEPPYYYAYGEAPEGKLKSNIGHDTKPVEIYDIRGREDEVSMDTTGFQFVKHVSQEKDFLDDEKIQKEYYKEVEDLLKKETGAKRVFIFDHTIRRAKTDNEAGPDGKPMRGPGERVHVDQTYEAGFNRVGYHLPEDAERLLKGRVRIINVWRPIGNPVEHKPLAVGDWRSIDPEKDLVSSKLIYPHREGSTFAVRYNPNHKFYFLSRQTPEEVILIKCFDSDESKARLTPHTAFLDPTSPPEAPHRQSIEVRCLVFDLE